jgi:hypothetical protein
MGQICIKCLPFSSKEATTVLISTTTESSRPYRLLPKPSTTIPAKPTFICLNNF